jgi:hypothetical protein
MEFVNVSSDVVTRRMPYLKKKIKDNFGDKGVSLYSLLYNEELLFIIMCTGHGLLIRSNGDTIKFSKGMTGALAEVEKSKYIIKPRIDYSLGDEGSISTDVSIVDRHGNEADICVLPSRVDDSAYPYRVCFTQFNKEKDMSCEVNYEYCADDGLIYPGLLTRVESVNMFRNVSKKGTFCRPGIVPSRMQMFCKNDIPCETLNYTFISFNEHGVFNTLLNGSYNLYNGAGYITRFCKLGFMNTHNQLVELPWPFGKYVTEEELLKWVQDNGFMVSVPYELIRAFNNQDDDIILLQEFLGSLDIHKKDRKYIRL